MMFKGNNKLIFGNRADFSDGFIYNKYVFKVLLFFVRLNKKRKN